MRVRLGAEERREQILDSVIPVIRALGPAAPSRRLAEAAGVAEGTIFRVFGDKKSLLRAVFERLAVHAYDLDGVAEADIGSLADFVDLLLGTVAARLGPFIELAPVLMHELRGELDDHADAGHGQFLVFVGDIARLLEPHRDELRAPVAVAAMGLGTMAIASAYARHAPDAPFSRAEAADLLLHGVALGGGGPPDPPHPAAGDAPAASPPP